jgi:hypothetical protein
MSAIRVLIGDMPAMLQSMVAAMLDAEEDMILIDPNSLGNDPQLARDIDVMLVAADRLSPNWLVGDKAVLPAGIIAIADDARSATIIHFAQTHWPLSDNIRDSIGAAIRRAVRPGLPN